MAKSIVGCGLCLLKDKIFAEVGNRIMTPQQAVLIERFVKFVALVYVKWWVRCPLVCESGLVDLELLRDIRAFPDDTVRKAAESAFKGHMWYLTEELSPVCLFSS